jgi:hypothetical protein
VRLLAATFPPPLQPEKETEIVTEIKAENFII